jgi:flagellar basal-body rod protein FlgB
MGTFIDRLLDQGSAPLLEQTLRFTAARHRLIAENVVNVDTPGYQQKDLSVEKFQALMRDRVEQRRDAGPGGVNFDDVAGELETPTRGILFHDGNNRSMEQLMSDQAKNAMMHNLCVELLRKQFQALELALKERVG